MASNDTATAAAAGRRRPTGGAHGVVRARLPRFLTRTERRADSGSAGEPHLLEARRPRIPAVLPDIRVLTAAIFVARIESPLGPLVAGATPEGICMLEFSGPKRLRTQLALLRRRFRAEAAPGRNKHIDRLERQLAEYFAGRRRRFDIPLVTPGTAFQRRVWKELARIPYGEMRTYGDLARRLGVPSASRAVGHANGSNPVSILLPCHRLVGSGGDLTGYGGGLWRKRRLLELETGTGTPSYRGIPMRRRRSAKRGSDRSSSKAESTPR